MHEMSYTRRQQSNPGLKLHLRKRVFSFYYFFIQDLTQIIKIVIKPLENLSAMQYSNEKNVKKNDKYN